MNTQILVPKNSKPTACNTTVQGPVVQKVISIMLTLD